MPNMFIKVVALLLAFVAVAHAQSQCTTYSYDLADHPNQGGRLTQYDGVEAFKLAFKEGDGLNPSQFDLDITLKPNTNANWPTSSQWWLVVSDGDNPKGEKGEYIIFYGCAFSTFASMYVYNGRNKWDSYKKNEPAAYGAPIHLGTVPMTVTELTGDKRRYQLSLNHDAVYQLGLQQLTIRANDGYDGTNLAYWDGASFNSKIGIWFHSTGDITATPDSQCAFNGDGEVTKWSTAGNLWLDLGNKNTVQQTSPCGPPPGGAPPSPPEVCDAKASGCCDDCNDQCAMPVPAGSGGMACMDTADGRTCSFSSNKKRLHVTGAMISGNGGD